MNEKDAWEVAFSLGNRDLASAMDVINMNTTVVNRLGVPVRPIFILGPSHPRIHILINQDTTRKPFFNRLVFIEFTLSNLGPWETRLAWMNGDLAKLLASIVNDFQAQFDKAPSCTNFAQMFTCCRLVYKIVRLLDISLTPAILSISPDASANANATLLYITVESWKFPPQDVSPLKAWQPETWPSWRFSPSVAWKPRAIPNTITDGLSQAGGRWISNRAAEITDILHS